MRALWAGRLGRTSALARDSRESLARNRKGRFSPRHFFRSSFFAHSDVVPDTSYTIIEVLLTQVDQAQQSQNQAPQSKPAPPPTAQDQKKKKDDSQATQSKRMFGVVPNFGAVNANAQLPPMSTREKFVLASKDSVIDYSSYTWAGILAGQAMLMNSDPELGHGVAGYGRYYWRTFTDGVSGTFFTEAIVPALTHEDPRYYTLGKGGFFHRTGYAISRAFVTKTDAGGNAFNWSEVGGNALEAGLVQRLLSA